MSVSRSVATGGFAIAVVCIAGLSGAGAARGGDDVEFRRSLATESDSAGWNAAGFRLSLGYGYGWEHGLAELPEATAHTVIIRAGARLDAEWSVLGSFQYAFADGGFSALSYLVTVDPTWHLGHGFDAAIGLGFGGLGGASLADWEAESDPDYDVYEEHEHSQTLPDTDYPLPECSGQGPAALVRVGWTLVLDDIWALAVHAETHARWIACESSTGAGQVDDETGEPIVGRQWWAMLGANLGLSFAWR